MAPPETAGLEISFRRAMLFINLAVEQLRLRDSLMAEAIHDVYVNGLSQILEGALRKFDHDENSLTERGRLLASLMDRVAQEATEDAAADMPQPPPGLGYGILEEAGQRVWMKSQNIESDAKSTRDRHGHTDGTMPSMIGDYKRSSSIPQSSSAHGVIGDRRTSSSSRDLSGERVSAMVTALNKNPDPMGKTEIPHPSITPSASKLSTIRQQVAIPLGLFAPKPKVELQKLEQVVKEIPVPEPKYREPSPTPSITITPAEEKLPQPPTEHLPIQQPKANSSWAAIAAIPKTAPAPVSFSGHFNSGVNKAHPVIRKPRSSSGPTESLVNQLRAIWIANLPSTYTLRDVSVQIKAGPLMSILVGDNLADTLPGRSACIIFEQASHARAFLAANNNGVPVATSHVSPIPAVRYVATAPEAYILPGAPYPADADILSMGAPLFVRRRLKWSRSRLFYDVPLAVFKEDIYSIVGGDENVELFHFYNPGECTVVFSSIKVAVVCYEQFLVWAKEVAQRDASGAMLVKPVASSAPITTAGTSVTPDGGKGGRYEKIDVNYVHDFNETPMRLYTQFEEDGSVRKGANEAGVEGWYGGPGVTAVMGSSWAAAEGSKSRRKV